MDVEDAVSDDTIYPDFASKDTHPNDCCCCGCTHIGSLIVVCEAPQQAGQPRSLWCVVGPYWSMMLFCTTPLILVPCAAATLFISTRVHPALTIAFAAATLFVLGSLWKTATSNPGLVVRRTRDPDEGQKGSRKQYSYDDRTKTWRPISARYADDCGVLVEGYDHTCPWTGTAIGAGNLTYFYMFTGGLFPLIIFLVGVMMYALSMEPGPGSSDGAA